MRIVPVILSGGSGTRLWPLSRKQYPKQYLPLVGENTMLQETILRLKGLKNLTDPIIVCNVDHRFLVAEQCQQIGINSPTILLEPTGKNTAPAIAVAALQVLKDLKNTLLLVLSADHAIQDTKAFHSAIEIALQRAQEGKMVTFGIIPTEANTGYGYIKFPQNVTASIYKVERFVEKPDLKTAESYLKKGNYLWNSGMFVFRTDSLIDELSIYADDVIKVARNAVDHAVKDLDFIRLNAQAFESFSNISIDCALMEKSNNVVVVPLDAGWSDVGSWEALHSIGAKDDSGNVVNGNAIIQEVSDSYIRASNRMVVAIGVKGLVVVDTPNAILISAKDQAQEVKSIVDQLQRQNKDEGSYHRKVYRPWGWYDSVESGKSFQVKRLHVNPGAKLSLQMHRKRAEHWVVVNGTATVINGEETLTLKKGDSTYIPCDTIHGLENKENSQLEIIEVQSGSYLGEDDIVRLEDIYGRVKTN